MTIKDTSGTLAT